MGAELSLDAQVSYIDAYLMYEPKEQLVLNPFIGMSNSALMLEIRKSLIELRGIKEGKAIK